MWSNVALSFQQGNPYVWVMMTCLFFAFVVLFERLIMLQFVYHLNFQKFLTNLKKMISAEDLSRAINFCKSVSNTSLPRIAMRTLEARETDPTTVRGTLEEESLKFLPKLESRLSILPGLAIIIMFVGVLGTIDSLSVAFRSIDILDTSKKQAVLAQGIAAALNPTAMGLLAAMFILFVQQILRGMCVRIVDEMHHGITVLYNLLVPAETVSYVAAPMSNASPHYEVPEQPQQQAAAAAPAPQEAAHEHQEEPPVDDIKDEEEII